MTPTPPAKKEVLRKLYVPSYIIPLYLVFVKTYYTKYRGFSIKMGG